jgi:flagellar assembly protein FliH
LQIRAKLRSEAAMANSSDWIAEVTQPELRAAPRWFEAVGAPGGFCDAWPFGKAPEDWPCPDFASPPAEKEPAQPAPTSDLDILAQAFAEGEAAGRAAALAEAEQFARHQRALRLSFRALDEAALEVLARELSDTVLALCDQMLADCAIDPDRLLARCQEAARRLGSGAGDAVLRLHPDDLAMLDDAALVGWQIVPDAALDRGGLLLEGADGAVADGPSEWRRAIAAALGA